jgi:hypothetical protein
MDPFKYKGLSGLGNAMLSPGLLDAPTAPTYLDPLSALPPNTMTLAREYARARGPIANALGLLSRHPQPPFDDALRGAAWERSAGHIDEPSCVDEEGVTLYRNARPGELGAWDKAHIVDGILGGVDHPSNLRALNEASNRRQGARLGNARRGLR